jgi:DNA repair exonuclease SbcCD ATPase subunit
MQDKNVTMENEAKNNGEGGGADDGAGKSNLRKRLEDHIVSVAIAVAISSAGTAWTAYKAIDDARVAVLEAKNRALVEEITGLDKEISDLKAKLKEGAGPCLKELNESKDQNTHLETQLQNALNQIDQKQKDIQACGTVKSRLERQLSMSEGNCSVEGQIREVQGLKTRAEQFVHTAPNTTQNWQRIQDYRTEIAGYEARILSLQQRLTCVPH